MQAPAEYRMDTESLENMYVCTSDGSMSPLSHFVRLTKTNGPSDLTPGYSSGQVLKAIKGNAAFKLYIRIRGYIA